MPTVTRITEIKSIQPGPGSTILADGTIQDPEPYSALDIEFSDGLVVQVERPATKGRVQAAYNQALKEKGDPKDGISLGDIYP